MIVVLIVLVIHVIQIILTRQVVLVIIAIRTKIIL